MVVLLYHLWELAARANNNTAFVEFRGKHIAFGVIVNEIL